MFVRVCEREKGKEEGEGKVVRAVVTVSPPPAPKKESQRRGVRWNEGDMSEEPFMAHCGAEMGIRITFLALCANLHASMPPTGCTDGLGGECGGWTGNESATGEERGGAAMEGGEEITDCSGSGRRIERNNPGAVCLKR